MKKKYVLIIGKSPSKGARSPILWNKVFKKKKIDCKMSALDIPSKNILKKKFIKLQKDKYFLGGAITTPYKEDIAKLLKNRLTPEAKKIKAVNCLFRKKNILYGTNTDGEAAVEILVKSFGNIQDKRILLIGFGGAGKAIAAYLSVAIRKKNSLNILIKNNKKYKSNYIFINYRNLKLGNYDIIINATSMGFDNKRNLSPLSQYDIINFKPNCFIFDIIYNPKKTKFINMCKKHYFKTKNGLDMNLRQAAIAFKYTIKVPKIGKIKKIMEIMTK